MISVHFQMPLANNVSWRRYLAQRVVELPAVPREGETIVATPEGLEEEVTAVWWDLDQQVVKVSIGGKHTKSRCVEFNPDDDIRVNLREAGWDVS